MHVVDYIVSNLKELHVVDLLTHEKIQNDDGKHV